MKHLTLVIYSFALLLINSLSISAQSTCDEINNIVNQNLKIGNRTFISDGQVYKAFLDGDENAEFQTTFFSGSTYRISTSAGDEENFVVFTVYDQERNVLFANENFEKAQYWDFQTLNTVTCTIEARLDPTLKSSGCLVMMIGFEQIH